MAAVAVVDEFGETVVLCGLAERPILQSEALNPPDDFKGSAAYRRALVPVIVERALLGAQG